MLAWLVGLLKGHLARQQGINERHTTRSEYVFPACAVRGYLRWLCVLVTMQEAINEINKMKR